LPAYSPDKISSVIAIEFEGEPNVLPIVTSGKSIIASSTDPASNTNHLNDGNPNTKWQAIKGATKASLEIDLGSVIAINAMSLVEPWHPWSGIKQTHELQYFDNGIWKSISKLTTDGTGSTESFKEIKAQKFRLLLENQKEAPAIGEFILYR
jgi:alpha-L-fucosidase